MDVGDADDLVADVFLRSSPGVRGNHALATPQTPFVRFSAIRA
jgi:hypothetical protein